MRAEHCAIFSLLGVPLPLCSHGSEVNSGLVFFLLFVLFGFVFKYQGTVTRGLCIFNQVRVHIK